MSHDKPKKKGLRARVMDAARKRLGKNEPRKDAPLVSREEPPTAALPALPKPVAALLEMVERRLGDLVDATSSRLLALDDEAAQLAFLVEQATEHHGREAVMALVLRHNLLLNGTMLAAIEPLLMGKNTLRTTPEVLDRGRHTLTHLLVDLTLLDEDLDADAPPEHPEDRVEWLEEHLFEDRFEGIRDHLLGLREPEDTSRFLMGSYMLFLQTFLMRTLVRSMGLLTRDETRPLLSDKIDDEID